MTHRIYYTEPSCREFAAIVTRSFEHDGKPAALLDRTAFYPTSGGQPFDIGRLESIDVIETLEADGEVVHLLALPLSEGARVQGRIDWARRFDHMQQHTGQHVLSAAFDRRFDNRTMSFHMGAETSSIDLSKEVSAAEIEQAVDESNRVVWEDRPVAIRFVSANEAGRLPLRKEPVREGRLRLIEIADFDLSACGGTHVARTGAIGTIAVLGAERFRGGSRLTFVCGGRTLRALRTYRDAVAGSVRALSVLPAELPSAVERLQSDMKQLRKTVGRLQESLAVHEAERLFAETPPLDGRRVVVRTMEGWDAAALKIIAAALIAREAAAAVLFTTTSPAAVVVARSSGIAIDAEAVLRSLMSRFGGRGGGKPDLAQGAGLTGTLEEMTDYARTLINAT